MTRARRRLRAVAAAVAAVLFLTIGTPLATSMRARAQDRPVDVSVEEPSGVALDPGVAERLTQPEAAADLTTLPESAARAAGVSGSPPPDATPVSLPSGPGKSAVTPQAISLPSAEGSIQGMGESFAPVLSSGTATFSVPIALAPGRAGVQPSLALAYASSSGNGPVGIGWSLGVPFLARQTDRGLPRYVDRPRWHAEEDRFLYSGGQELVAVSDTDVASVDPQAPGVSAKPAELATWQEYRARVEGGFMRFFRAPDSRRWVVLGKDGTRFDFGALAEGPPEIVTGSVWALQSESAGGVGRIFAWQLTRMSDAHGSTVYYRYDEDDGQRYLRDIHYVSPGSCAATGRACTASLADFGRRVALVYAPREDAWSSYVPTWRVRTARRLVRIDVFAAEGAPGARTLVRRYHLGYDPGSYHSLLAQVQVEGRPELPDAATATSLGNRGVPEGSPEAGRLLPPIMFAYTRPPETTDAVPGLGGIDATVHTSGASPPHSVDEARSDLFDVNSDGLPDLIVTDPARYHTASGDPAVGVFFNGFTGASATPGVAGDFSAAVAVPMPPALSGVMTLSNLNVVPMDIDGDGRSDLLHMPRLREYGYFTLGRDPATAAEVSPASQGWRFVYVPRALPAGETDPRIDLGRDGEHIRSLDVDNDHLVDVVRTTGTTMQTWLNLGRYPGGDGRFGRATWDGVAWRLTTAPLESCVLSSGLPVDFSDPEVTLADMNGDGIQDIVKMRRGRVQYWPGRGAGAWGTALGTGTCAGTYVDMTMPPAELSPELDGAFLEDVNEDGAADVVQVRFDAVDVWFNRGGESFAPRVIARRTPATPAFAPRVRFADIDGSGTTDIVWANADRWRWIDPMGGVEPRLLTRVDNGLGALTTMEYGSSAADYLRDLAAAASTSCAGPDCERFLWQGVRAGCDAKLQAASGECVARSGGSPVVSTVVRAVETTDRFDALGREANVSRTEFAYHDGYYEGIEEEFRGFGAADARAIGDPVIHPTSVTRTHFLQGRRADEIATDRLADNPDEALKGREFLTEVRDEAGRYLSSTHAGYVVRRLFAGLDGRAVSYAFVGRTDDLRYDLTPFSPGTETLSLTALTRQDTTGSVTASETRTIAVRGAGYARIASTIDSVDDAGNLLQQTALGRIRGEYGEPLDDERIVSHASPVRLPGNGGWLWRTARTFTTGQADDGLALGDTTSEYDATTGDLLVSTQTVASTTSYEFGGDTDGSAALTQTDEPLVASSSYDRWGNALASCGGGDLRAGTTSCLRYAAVAYDAGYAQFPESESVAVDRSAAPFRFVSTTATWDHGLGALLSATDPNGYTTAVGYDGLGRLVFVAPPPVDGCSAGRPTTRIAYEFTADPSAEPVSVVRTFTELDCSAVGADVLEARSYVDGLGRARASLAESEHAGEWIQTGVMLYGARGTAHRAYQPARTTDASLRGAVSVPAVPFTRARYDAFGRQVVAIAEDGAETWTHYHALSTDVCDPLDNDPSEPQFFRTCTTARTDGQGRVIDQTLRQRLLDSADTEYHRLFSYYRADGVLLRLVRAKTAAGVLRPLPADAAPATSVERTFFYDTAGRRLASTDPDSDSGNPTRTSANRTWRYLFNRAGDLAAMRDPRGCGQNFYYDHAGRLLGEDYVSCAEAQGSGEISDTSVPAGAISMGELAGSRLADVRYSFDTYPSFATGEATPPGAAAAVNGRLTGVSDRGQRSVVAYDPRGDATWTARQMALLPIESNAVPTIIPDPPSVFTSDDGPITIRGFDVAPGHTYVRTARFDHAGRPASMALPRDPDWETLGGTGDGPLVGGTLSYNARGLPSSASATIDSATYPVVSAIDYDRDGLVRRVTWGDDALGTRAPTVSDTSYDTRRRPTRLFTLREAPASPPPSPGALSHVTVVMDQALGWDAASNLRQLRDDRVPEEWPDGQRPQTIDIRHDALYRVAAADFTYHGASSTASPTDTATDWRDEYARTAAVDPMRPKPPRMLSAPPASRTSSLTWEHDWLGNVTDWSDDAHAFYERSIGAITNGNSAPTGLGAAPALRPSALYLAADLAGPPTDRGGWLELDYGEGGNAVAVTVHAQCTDAPTSTCADPGGSDLATRRASLRATCACAVEQHYQYRWDELDRLVEARRYDRKSGNWRLAVRHRYRYDSANQRTVKETLDSLEPERLALYVYPGDFERRGLTRAPFADTYTADAILDTETEYLVAGARIVWKRSTTPTDPSLDQSHRITVAIPDLIGTNSSVLDLRTGALLESSTYYPNGARETFRATDTAIPAEPFGFTGKEADQEVGLTYFGERYLISHLGRWASPDPLQIHAVGGGEAVNAYHYVSGGLLQAMDPIGLDFTGDKITWGQFAALPSATRDGISNAAAQGQDVQFANFTGDEVIEADRDPCRGGSACDPAVIEHYEEERAFSHGAAEVGAVGATGALGPLIDAVQRDGVSGGAAHLVGVVSKDPPGGASRMAVVFGPGRTHQERVARSRARGQLAATGVVLMASAASAPLATAPRPPRSALWSMRPTERGRVIERALGQNLPDTFPTIDRFDPSGLATSMKSLDLAARSYQRINNLRRTVRRYIDSVAAFNGGAREGVVVAGPSITGRALDLAVPAGGTRAQLDALGSLVDYGRSVGVHVNVVVIE